MRNLNGKNMITVKDVREKIRKAESVRISISDDAWALLGDDARVVRLEGTPEVVNREALSFMKGGARSVAKAAIVLFCNPEDTLRIAGAVPAEEAAEHVYGVCYAARPLGTVEMYIVYN